MENKRGEVATLLTLGLVIVGTLVALGTSLFVSNKKTNLASNSRAACSSSYHSCTTVKSEYTNGGYYASSGKYYKATNCANEITEGVGNYCKALNPASSSPTTAPAATTTPCTTCHTVPTAVPTPGTPCTTCHTVPTAVPTPQPVSGKRNGLNNCTPEQICGGYDNYVPSSQYSDGSIRVVTCKNLNIPASPASCNAGSNIPTSIPPDPSSPSCTSGSYMQLVGCEDICGIGNCKSCKLNSTIKYECKGVQNLRACVKSRTYASFTSCEMENCSKCTQCKFGPDDDVRYECDGPGPTMAPFNPVAPTTGPRPTVGPTIVVPTPDNTDPNHEIKTTVYIVNQKGDTITNVTLSIRGIWGWLKTPASLGTLNDGDVRGVSYVCLLVDNIHLELAYQYQGVNSYQRLDANCGQNYSLTIY